MFSFFLYVGFNIVHFFVFNFLVIWFDILLIVSLFSIFNRIFNLSKTFICLFVNNFFLRIFICNYYRSFVCNGLVWFFFLNVFYAYILYLAWTFLAWINYILYSDLLRLLVFVTLSVFSHDLVRLYIISYLIRCLSFFFFLCLFTGSLYVR